jgi:ribosomal protein S12 methylthiotransferase
LKTRSHKKNKINVITLGCSKNLVDSEILMGQLKASSFDVVHESDRESEIVIINTCGFIDNAKQESIDTILRYAQAKEDGLIEKLYVTGCLSERYKPALEKEIPNVDEYFGTRDLPRLIKTLGADYKHELIGDRLITTPIHYAYLKVSEGCDRPCSFCAIPLMRGKHISKSVESIVTEANHLAAKGTKELILIAQDLTYYGLDLYGKRNLSHLLGSLTEVEGIEWIRLHYAFPGGFPLDILDVISNEEKICSYLDMPLQHISDRMLKSMRRGTTRDRTNRLIDTIRDKVPGIALRTTLIAGYPGESESDFEEMYEWVEKTKFDRLGIFAYSHEENTHAYLLKDDVSEDIKQERISAIMDLQQTISLDLNKQKEGSTFKVLFDRKEGNQYIGRTEFDSPEVDNEVVVDAGIDYVRLGDFADVRITSSSEFDLFGEIV